MYYLHTWKNGFMQLSMTKLHVRILTASSSLEARRKMIDSVAWQLSQLMAAIQEPVTNVS
jgi:hypothetical protein